MAEMESSGVSSLIKYTGPIPTLRTSFDLVTSLWVLSPNTVTWQVRALSYEFEGNTVHNTNQGEKGAHMFKSKVALDTEETKSVFYDCTKVVDEDVDEV